FFCDDTTDTDTSANGVCGAPGSASTTAVTYVLFDDLVAPVLATNAIPVSVTIGLDQLPQSASQPFKFAFVLGRLFGINNDPNIPPRIVSVTPSPIPALPGWGRQINQQLDFGMGQTLDQDLATVDGNFIGAN